MSSQTLMLFKIGTNPLTYLGSAGVSLDRLCIISGCLKSTGTDTEEK